MPNVTAAPTTTQNGPDTVTATPLTIGPVTFRRFECPSQIPGLGAVTHKLVTHEYTGGSRVINKFGAQPVEVSWTGNLWQPFLDNRITSLRQLDVLGIEVPLTWRNEKWFAIVKDFDPGYHHANHTQYKITVLITRSGNGALSPAIATSLDSQIAALLNDAKNAALVIDTIDPDSPPELTPLLAQVSLDTQNAGPLAQAAGTPASVSLGTSISNALSTANDYLDQLQQVAPTFVPAKNLVATLGLMQTNVQRGQSQLTVPAPNGSSMYELASTQYGDITKALAVADFNNAVSPRLTSTTTTPVVLPSYAKAP